MQLYIVLRDFGNQIVALVDFVRGSFEANFAFVFVRFGKSITGRVNKFCCAHAAVLADAPLDDYGYTDLYAIRWTPKQGFEEIEDESDACNWDNPEECERENGLGYNPETGRIA